MPTKKTFNILLCALLFLNIFFLSAIASFRIVLGGEMISVPDLKGKTMEEAKVELSRKKMAIVQKGYQHNITFERGKIIHQDPSPGSKIQVKKAVKVILSGGSEKVIVPRLEGRSLEASGQVLREAGLRRGNISQIHTSQYPAGRIIAQEPRPLEETERNTQVNLLVSQGEREDRYLMPDLIGKRVKSIMAGLKDMDFKVADIRYAYYPGLEPGIIIKQFPPHGFRIQKRNLITLEVSK